MTAMDATTDRLINHGWSLILDDLAALAMRRVWQDAVDVLRRELGVLKGQRRVQAEASNVQAILAAAEPPEAMHAAPVAPARGAMQLVDNIEMSRGGIRHVDGAHWRGVDRLSIMCRHAYERYRKAHPVITDKTPPFVAPFSAGQVCMGQHYAALIERHDAAGIKCVSIEGRQGGSGKGGGFIEAYLAEGDEIAEIRRRIGGGVAMQVRRARTGGGGGRPAVSITDRVLVDMVCLQGCDLSAVLVRFGWCADGKNRKALREALCAALDRMQGYREKGD